MEKVKQCEIRLEICESSLLAVSSAELIFASLADGASDHVPVVLDVEGPL
jgi:endonuclease/exonuclease/phosphatase family metal-dependent hydrolase